MTDPLAVIRRALGRPVRDDVSFEEITSMDRVCLAAEIPDRVVECWTTVGDVLRTIEGRA